MSVFQNETNENKEQSHTGGFSKKGSYHFYFQYFTLLLLLLLLLKLKFTLKQATKAQKGCRGIPPLYPGKDTESVV